VEDSDDFSQSWLTSSSTLTSVSDVEAPDGSSNVFELSHTANGSHIRLNTNVTTDVRYTYGIFMKYVDHQWVAIAHNNSSSPYHTWFDIQNGVKGSNAGADTSITPVGNGWYLLQAPQIANDTTSYFQVHLSVGDESNTESVGTSAYVFGAHIYRSDLGGMGQVPGTATGFEYYVPTSGSAKRLPRVGHHVYSGSAWVNEGLLIESEARTNLVTYSEDFANAAWLKTDATISGTLTSSPDGQTNGRTVTFAGTNDLLRFIGPSCSVGESYTASIWAKAGTSSSVKFSVLFSGSGLGSVEETITLTSEWQRFTISGTVPSGTPDTARMRFTSLEAGSIQVFGAQLEENSTASSYIPTSGATVTRAAQTLAVPPAAFGWPEPEYLSGELVTNGTFDTDTTGWTGYNYQGHSVTISSVSGELTVVNDPTNGGNAAAYQAIPTVIGQVYSVSVDFISTTTGTPNVLIRNSVGGATLSSITTSGAGVYTTTFTATATSTLIIISQNAIAAGNTTKCDNISVREINPLSVSIQMDGRITYANEGAYETTIGAKWRLDFQNEILIMNLSTNSSDVGRPFFSQEAGGVTDNVSTSGSPYSPGTLVPFNISSRHGSTFINGAVDGVALTANITPTALPDLSGSNIEIAHDFMGTIRTFRQFAGDIGDAGLVTATS